MAFISIATPLRIISRYPSISAPPIVFFTGASLPLVRLAVLLIDASLLLAAMRISRLYFPVGFAAAILGPHLALLLRQHAALR